MLYVYNNWLTLLYSKNQHNIINQLYSNKNFKNRNFPGGPVQRIQVWSLVRKDPRCPGATEPMGLPAAITEAHALRAWAPQEKALIATTREKSVHSNKDPVQTKRNT